MKFLSLSACILLLVLYDAEGAIFQRACFPDLKLSTPRFWGVGVSIDDLAIFAGGRNNSAGIIQVPDVDIYNATSRSFSYASLSQARTRAAAASSGQIAMFAGGYVTTNTYSSVVDIYNISSKVWTTHNLAIPRKDMGAVSVGDDSIWFAGGMAGDTEFYAEIDIYNTTTQAWTSDSLSSARYLMGSATLGDVVVFAGGRNETHSTDLVDIYHISSKSWSKNYLSQPRYWPGAAASGDLIVIAGGTGHPVSTRSSRVDIFNVRMNSWSIGPDLYVARSGLKGGAFCGIFSFAGGYSSSSYSKDIDVFNSISNSMGLTYLTTPMDLLSSAQVGNVVFYGAGSYGLEQDDLEAFSIGGTWFEVSATLAEEGNTVVIQYNETNVHFGDPLPNTDVDVTFRIVNMDECYNISLANLAIEGPGFAIQTDFDKTYLDPHEVSSFTIRMSSSVLGALSGRVTFNTDNELFTTFSFDVSGHYRAPEVEVKFNTSILIDGTSVVDVGRSLDVDSNYILSFKVHNVGSGSTPLTLWNPKTTGYGFYTAEEIFPSSVEPGQFSNLLMVSNSSYRGELSGSISFNNNDANENPFSFGLTAHFDGPKIDVYDTVVSSSSPLAPNDEIDLGSVVVDAPVFRTFVVENGGELTLNLTTPVVSGTGFSLNETFSSFSLEGSSSATFKIQMIYNEIGDLSDGRIRIDSNDLTEGGNPFFLDLTGKIVQEAASSGAGTSIHSSSLVGIVVVLMMLFFLF